MATLALLSIVTMPLTVELLAAYYGQLLYLLVGLVLLTPYVMWSRAHIAAGESSRELAT